MAGHEIPLGAPQGLPARKARAEDRRLREPSSVPNPSERILADNLDRGLEQLRAEAFDHDAHVIGLAPLPGEQDRAGGHAAARYAREGGWVHGDPRVPPVRGARCESPYAGVAWDGMHEYSNIAPAVGAAGAPLQYER